MTQINLFTGQPVETQTVRKRNAPARRARVEQGELSEQVGRLVDAVVRQQERIGQLERTVLELTETIAAKKTIKESYTTAEVAKILGKKPYTVREWCRLKRIDAFKAMCGRGSEVEWRVSHEELERFQNEGLLPVPERY